MGKLATHVKNLYEKGTETSVIKSFKKSRNEFKLKSKRMPACKFSLIKFSSCDSNLRFSKFAKARTKTHQSEIVENKTHFMIKVKQSA